MTYRQKEKGFTLLELMIVLVIIGILAAIALPVFSGITAKGKLDIALFELGQHWKSTRYDAMTDNNTRTICIDEDSQVKYAQIVGGQCSQATSWSALPAGVKIDTQNSTLIRVRGVSGSRRVYRVSWANTRAGYGGSSGRLGKIVFTSGHHRKCLVLFTVQGDFQVREGRRCMR